jgi:chromosomal replication initiator protein
MDPTRARTPQEIWETALGELQIQVSRANYRTWLSKTAGLSYRDNIFVISVPNTFAAEYLEKNQRSLIEKALRGLTGPDVQVLFQVNGKSIAKTTVGSGPADSPPPPASTRLNPDYVFDSFIEGIAQVAAAARINVICASAEQFTNEFLSALRERNTDDFRNKYRSIGMLLIDDIQFIGGKEQTEESFFHTFNELHNTNRQIVITSDCPPKSMPLMEERLRSRFEWGLLVDIQPPDYETRLAILESKAGQKGVAVSRDVLELIAREAHTNIRVLEGSLNRVVAYARLLRASPTVDIARKALEDVAGRERDNGDITPAAIIQAVAKSFKLPREELSGKKRDKDTAMARRLAMYLMRQETNFSLVQIGKELGNRDAASVTAACRQIAGSLE